ncbi:MAG: anaerobic ribonucleoside-triphosphate reductase [Promethearchaeota archaeon]
MELASESEISKKKKIKKSQSKYLKNLLPRVFRTEGDMVVFDPSKILNSLMKETAIKEKDANHITELVVRRIISSGIKFLSGPHIREIVCSILSEQHYESERKLYTRIGMPLMDYEEILEYGIDDTVNNYINPEIIHNWAANRISNEYAHLRILNSEESQAHLYGDIHIHMLQYFDLRPFCQEWDPRLILKNGLPPVVNRAYFNKSGPAKNLKMAVAHVARWLGMIQCEFSGTQGYHNITPFLAPYAKDQNNEQIKHCMQFLIFEINQIFTSKRGQFPYISISCLPRIPDNLYDIPAIGPYGRIIGKYGDYHEECLKLFDALNYVYSKGDYDGKSFNFPRQEININKSWIKDFEPRYLKLFEELAKKRNLYFYNMNHNGISDKKFSLLNYVNRGSLQCISLNLPRYTYLSNDEDEFLRTIDEKMELCSRILLKKRDLINKRLKTGYLPLCRGKIDGAPIFKLEEQNLSISFTGLNETVKCLTDFELHNNKVAYELGKKILNDMATKCTKMSERDGVNYYLSEQPNDISSKRLASLDLKHFPKKAIPLNRGVYTKSSNLRYNAEISLFERIKKEGEFHPLIKGKPISYLSFSGKKPNMDEIWELTKNICLNTNIAYFFLNLKKFTSK